MMDRFGLTRGDFIRVSVAIALTALVVVFASFSSRAALIGRGGGTTTGGGSDAMTTFLATLSNDQWGTPSNTTASAVYYVNDTGAVDYNATIATNNQGSGGSNSADSIWTDWSGGAYDSVGNRGIVFGGGHLSYCGNEMYGFNFSTLLLQRIQTPDDYQTQLGACATFNPTLPYMPNGDAIDLHEYSTPVFIPGLFTKGAVWYGQPFYSNPMYYDLSKGRPYGSLPTTLGAPGSGWTKTASVTISGTTYALTTPSVAVYDSPTNRIYVEILQLGGGPPTNLIYWDVAGNTWVAVAGGTTNFGMVNGATGLERVGHGEIWAFWQDATTPGGSGNSNGMVVNLSTNVASYFSDSNFDTAFPGGAGTAGTFVGACYVASTDKFYLWGGGNTLLIFDPTTKTSSTYTTTGTVPSLNFNSGVNEGAMTKFWCDTVHHAIINWYDGGQAIHVLKTSKF